MNTNNMEYTFLIVTGDSGGDGHGQSDDFYFKTNYPIKDIEAAYEKSCKDSSVNFGEICQEYGDSSIDEDVLKKLKKFGVDITKDEIEEFSDYVGSNDLIELIIKFIKVSMPSDFKYSRTYNDIPCIGEFGYGLYQ